MFRVGLLTSDDVMYNPPHRGTRRLISSALRILLATISPHKGIAVLAPFPSCSWLCLLALSTKYCRGFPEVKTSRCCEGTCSGQSSPDLMYQGSLPQRAVLNVFNYSVSSLVCTVNFRNMENLGSNVRLKFLLPRLLKYKEKN